MCQQHLKPWVAVFWMTADSKVTSATIRKADRRARLRISNTEQIWQAAEKLCDVAILFLVIYGAEKARAKTCLRSTAL